MRKFKLENLVAIIALTGMLYLFGTFMIGGNNASAVLTIAGVAGAVALLSILSRFFCKNGKPVLRGISACLMCVILLGSIAVHVDAALGFDVSGFTVSQLSVTAVANGGDNSESTVTGSGSVITVVAKGYNTTDSCNETVKNADTVTVEVTNISPAAVTYDLTLSNVSGATAGTGLTLESQKKLTFTIKSGEGAGQDVTGTITFSNVKSVSTGAEETTRFGNMTRGDVGAAYSSTFGGTYTVDGTPITETVDMKKASSHEYTLAATAAQGYTFAGWMSKCGGRLSTDSTYPYTATEGNNDTVWPLFIKTGSAQYYIKDANPVVYYGFMDDAIAAAGNSGTIVLFQSGSMYGTSGTSFDLGTRTLLVPYLATDLSIDAETATVEGGMNSTLEHANKKLVISNRDDMLMPHNKVTYTLTIPSDTTVNVASGGKFVIGGTICCGHDSYIGIIGGTAGDHSNVQLEGTLNVGGILSSCGYILGNGQINVANGGAAYQPFVAMDQRNGQYVVGTTTGNDNIFPWNRYALMNIQCNVKLAEGASMKGYIDAYTAAVDLVVTTLKERHTVACQTIIGPSNALYNVAGGSVDISYDPNKHVNDVDYTTGNAQYGKGLHDRVGTTTIEFNGNVSIGSLTLTLNVAGSNYSVNSNTDYFPIPYNFQIHQNSGTFTVSQKLKLLPGALLHIHENATLNVTKQLAAMDGFSDQCDVTQATMSADKYARYRYPVAADLMAAGFCGTAQLIVDGTMTVSEGAAFGGVVQTNGSGTVTMSGTPGLTVIMGPRSQERVSGTTANISGRTVYDLSPRLYVTGENKTLVMETNKTYVAIDGETHTIPDFSYTLHTTANKNSATVEVSGRELNAGVIGTWKCAEGSHTVVTDAAVPPTCTETGLTEGSHCSACGEVIVPQEVVSALGHGFNSSTGGCNICGTPMATAAIWSGSTATYYQSLGAALNDYGTSADYIQMMADTDESVTITGTINLDLNGHTIAEVTVSGTLNGMDTTTNAYGIDGSTGGSISVVKNSGKVVPVYQYQYKDQNEKDVFGKKYVACWNGDSVSFHRFDLGIWKYDIFGYGDTGAITFTALFKGDGAALKVMTDKGFMLDGVKQKSVVGEKNFATETVADKQIGVSLAVTLGGFNTEGGPSFTDTIPDVSAYITANAQDFEDDIHTVNGQSFVSVLRTVYDSITDQVMKEKIEVFVENNGLTEAFNTKEAANG